MPLVTVGGNAGGGGGGVGVGGTEFGPVDVPDATIVTIDAFSVTAVRGGRIYLTVEDLVTGDVASALVHLVSDGTTVQYSSPSDVGKAFFYDVEMVVIGTTLNVQIQNNHGNTLRFTGNRLLF